VRGDAPLTVWLRPSPLRDGLWFQSILEPPEPDAVEYVRKDVCDAMLTEASRQLLQAARVSLDSPPSWLLPRRSPPSSEPKAG
jgi:hypothetical protein